MLVPLTRDAFKELVPLGATGPQYRHYWGDWSTLVRRLLISFLSGLAIVYGGRLFFGVDSAPVLVVFGFAAWLYWLWGPVAMASWRNGGFRQLPYCGFWRGRVLDVFITEELSSVEETVDEAGELVVVEHRERRVNLEIGDETGFSTQVQAPIQREHKRIRRGQTAEMLVLSSRADLSRINKVTDVFLPEIELWVGEYPYLERSAFAQLSEDLYYEEDLYEPESASRRPSRRR